MNRLNRPNLHPLHHLLAVICLALFCAGATTVRAAVICQLNVTSTADSGPGTLRDALACASNGDTIDATGVTGTIVLTSGELLVSNSVTILGPGPAALTVDGNFPNTTNRVFYVTNEVAVTISGLAISNGFAAGSSVVPERSGGGIFNDHSTLTLDNCVVTRSSAQSLGGGILNYGNDGSAALTIINSTISRNSSEAVGGGIFNFGGDVEVTLRIDHSTINANTAAAGGGIANDAQSSRATVVIVNSTLSGNLASLGGAIDNLARESSNGAIQGTGIVTIANSTFSGNSFASVHNRSPDGYALVELASSILNGFRTITNESGTVASFGYNLSSDDGGSFLTDPTDQPSTNPMLGPLQDNGGPTFTHSLLPCSPAIDKGLNFAIFTATDQRGLPRPVDDPNIANAAGGDGTDIGAFEVQTLNHVPVAHCKDVTVVNCGPANASIDNGSFDPDGDPITLVQSPPGPYPLGATLVTLTVTDCYGASNTCQATVTIVPNADLLISKAAVSGQAKPGQILIYTIIVTNIGPCVANSVVVTDPVPQGTTFYSASPPPFTAPAIGASGTVTWNPRTLASGATATFTLKVKVSQRGNDLIVNTATVSAASPDPNTANNSATVTSKRKTK